jgi:hypothetical protein
MTLTETQADVLCKNAQVLAQQMLDELTAGGITVAAALLAIKTLVNSLTEDNLPLREAWIHEQFSMLVPPPQQP